LTTLASVLIVDRADETRDTLRAVLEQQGLAVQEARTLAEAQAAAHAVRPEVVVLDADGLAGDGAAVVASLASAAEIPTAQVLVLASRLRRHDSVPRGQLVPKPYHYAPLIHRIEGLLASLPRAA
jgi:DNA-binding response OmpR family regulator